MDTTSVTHPPAVTQTRRRTYVIGACSTAIAVGGALWAVLKSGTADKSQLDSLAYVVIATLIVGVVVFAWLVPSRIAAGGTGLPLALVSVPLLYAFWSGIPLPRWRRRHPRRHGAPADQESEAGTRTGVGPSRLTRGRFDRGCDPVRLIPTRLLGHIAGESIGWSLMR
jgi:hypothetical protein